MSESQLEGLNMNLQYNPDEQINYAMKLIINSYEMKTQMYEAEIRRLSEDYERKTSDLEQSVESLTREKGILEEKLEGVINENKHLVEQLDLVTQENQKLERFKNSILISVNGSISGKSESNSITDRLSSNNLNMNAGSSFKMNSNMSVGSPQNSHKNNFTGYLNYNSNNPQNKKINLSIPIQNKSNLQDNKKQFSDNKIESLIEKLNESINNRIYSEEDDKNNMNVFNNLNNFSKSEDKLNKNMEDVKSKINKSYSNNKYSSPIKNEGLGIPNMKKTSASHLKNLNNRILYTPLEIESLPRDGPSFDEDRNSNSGEVNEKSSQYIQSSKFFSNCRIKLKQEEYAKLIETLKKCNNNKIDKFEAFKQIEYLLKSSNNNNLLSDFKSIFPTN